MDRISVLHWNEQDMRWEGISAFDSEAGAYHFAMVASWEVENGNYRVEDDWEGSYLLPPNQFTELIQIINEIYLLPRKENVQ